MNCDRYNLATKEWVPLSSTTRRNGRRAASESSLPESVVNDPAFSGSTAPMVTTTTVTTAVASTAAPAPAAPSLPTVAPAPVNVSSGSSSVSVVTTEKVSIVLVEIEGGLVQVIATVPVALAATVAAPSEESTTVLVVEGSFAGKVVITVVVKKFSMGSSKAKKGAKSRSSKLIFSANQPAVKAILISMTIVAGRRRQSVGNGNGLFQHWLNKKTNEWTIICSDSIYDATAGALQTVTPAAVFNDPAFNPTSGCAADFDGACDGSGGEFTVFELPADSCVATGDSGGLRDGAIAGIVIGCIAGFAILAYLAFACYVRSEEFLNSQSRDWSNDQSQYKVESSFVIADLGPRTFSPSKVDRTPRQNQDDEARSIAKPSPRPMPPIPTISPRPPSSSMMAPSQLDTGSFISRGRLSPTGSIMSVAPSASISVAYPGPIHGQSPVVQVPVVPFQGSPEPIYEVHQAGIMAGAYQPISATQAIPIEMQSAGAHIQPTSLYPAKPPVWL